MKVSKHANKRINKRIAHTDSDKLLEEVITNGHRNIKFVGNLRRYLDKISFTNNSSTYTYKGKVYVINNSVLVTVLTIPANLFNDYQRQIKKESFDNGKTKIKEE